MRLVKIFGHLKYVQQKGVINSVRDSGDARIRSSDAAAWVEVKNSATTTRNGSIVQVWRMCRDAFIPSSDPISTTDAYATSWYIFRGTFIPSTLHPHFDDVDVNADINVEACTNIDGNIIIVINANIDA
ncbi:hypothetical protein GOBAR_AA15387 [Gossypium barbadense]|uniref:Uncharacterized protein n=1 Tax=Gossypium barbadense TaxID=3634 RepID=A0A2P5XPK0_GOSBA|nr:hypothetical protein GOBAR_AA15387 [Gossypium barbadense]